MGIDAMGFREIEHTADRELEVWAPDLPNLLKQAALGMYTLTETRLEESPRMSRKFELQTEDRESLVVAFLEELLYYSEVENLGFDTFQLTLEEKVLSAKVTGAPILSKTKEIKAVTFHNLDVKDTEQGLRVNIVFDV